MQANRLQLAVHGAKAANITGLLAGVKLKRLKSDYSRRCWCFAAVPCAGFTSNPGKADWVEKLITGRYLPVNFSTNQLNTLKKFKVPKVSRLRKRLARSTPNVPPVTHHLPTVN
jgi:hypothetical protein